MQVDEWWAAEVWVSRKTYEVLKSELGKEFVDQSLIQILWFDPLLDAAEWKKNRFSEPFPWVSEEIVGILSDTDKAIAFAKNKIIKTKHELLDMYFPKELSKKATKDDIIQLIRLMMKDIQHKKSQWVVELWYNFMLIFTFYSEIEWRYKDILWDHWIKYVWDPAELCLLIKDFPDFLKQFLENFYSRLEKASGSEKNTIFFLSEFLRAQSGERDWVGNSMNFTFETLVSMLWTWKPWWAIRTKKEKIKNFILKQFPWTKKNQEQKITALLTKISRQFFRRV
jgi:hypothetical protein